MDVVPEDLVEAVHRAARTAPAHPADLAAVRRRARARRRRQGIAAATGLVALVALTGGAVPLVTWSPAAPPGTPTAGPTTSATAPPSSPARWQEPAQRLVTVGGPWPDAERRGGTVEEVLPDGSVRRHRVPKDFALGAALPDGRLVGLVYTDLLPGVARTDGPTVEGLSVRLTVLGPDGAVETSREVPVDGQGVELLGADERVAYLARDAGIVTHDLATGQERMLLRSSTAGVDLLAASHTDVRPDRLVEQRSDDGCHVDVRRTSDGTRVARLTVDGICVNGLRLSPDGTLVAVPYRLLDMARNRREQRLAVFDTTTGAQRADQVIGHPSLISGAIQGFAWADDATVRVAWTGLPVSAGRDASVDDLVRKVTTVRVQ